MPVKILLSAFGEKKINYENAVRAAGGEPVFDAYRENPERFDALILCGGGDLSPSYYHQEMNGTDPGSMDPKRDEREMELFRFFAEKEKPILGVCRGHQLISVALGGTLIQHLSNADAHKSRKSGEDLFHPTSALKGSWIETLYGNQIVTNSVHHQALDRIGTGLRAVQWSNDGVIEAAQHENGRIYSVQWHPERMLDLPEKEGIADGKKIFLFFIKLCEAEKKKKVLNLT